MAVVVDRDSFIYLSVCLFVYLSVRLFVYLTIYLSVRSAGDFVGRLLVRFLLI